MAAAQVAVRQRIASASSRSTAAWHRHSSRPFATKVAQAISAQHRLDVWQSIADSGREILSARRLELDGVSKRSAKISLRVDPRLASGFATHFKNNQTSLVDDSVSVECEAGGHKTLRSIVLEHAFELSSRDGVLSVVAADVNGQAFDLATPVEHIMAQLQTDVLEVSLLPLLSPGGLRTYWHSAAHLLGYALEAVHGDNIALTDGPSFVEGGGGFFYEAALPRGSRLSSSGSSGAAVGKALKALGRDKALFQHMLLTPPEAEHMFKHNPFKQALLQSLPSDARITAYRCGPFVDLCRGPHVAHTGLVRTALLTRATGSHWEGSLPAQLRFGADGTGEAEVDSQGVLLQRQYAVAFPDADTLGAWQQYMTEAAARDHRTIGTEQQLFMFHPLSPGSPFILPAGMRVYSKLVDTVKRELAAWRYDEVMTPQLFKPELWRTSGHWQHYREDMYAVTDVHTALHGMQGAPELQPAPPSKTHSHPPSEDEPAELEDHLFGIKPMNCPAHCLMFAASSKSYRDLPVRVADFSPLHRNEASGALSGLTRVRRFHQDDAHIFCSAEQVQQEVLGCLAMVGFLYSRFGFSFKLRLSTRPEAHMGDDETWDAAETALKEALDTFLQLRSADSIPAWYRGTPYEPAVLGKCIPAAYEVDEGGGAFYGPKIDVAVEDALGREHQCGTVQLDFQLPQRFHLKYAGADGAPHTPVIIHRALLGSVERMMAIMTEHTAGRWPFWLSPRQVSVLPVAERHEAAARRLEEACRAAGLHATVDASARSIPKKVRAAQVAQCNVMVVLGDEEAEAGTATLRWRDDATAHTASHALQELSHGGQWVHAVGSSAAHDSEGSLLSAAHPFTCAAAGLPELLQRMGSL